jgi:hypothetical protein
VVKAGINPSQPYSLNAIAKDASGNQSQESINFISPTLRKSILTLIIDSILIPFGWLAKLFQ